MGQKSRIQNMFGIDREVQQLLKPLKKKYADHLRGQEVRSTPSGFRPNPVVIAMARALDVKLVSDSECRVEPGSTQGRRRVFSVDERMDLHFRRFHLLDTAVEVSVVEGERDSFGVPRGEVSRTYYLTDDGMFNKKTWVRRSPTTAMDSTTVAVYNLMTPKFTPREARALVELDQLVTAYIKS